MELEEIKISYSMAEMINYHNEGVEKYLWEDQKIELREPDSTNYIFEKNDVDLLDEEKWFKEKVVKLLKEVRIYLFYTYKEEEIRKQMYAIYANKCYKEHKKVKVSFNTFNLWLNEYILNRSMLTEGGTVFYTFREMHFGRKMLKFTYLELEAIERLVDSTQEFETQKELIDNIFDCFRTRWSRESVIWNIVLSSINEVGTADLVANELFVKFEPQKTSVLFNNEIFTFAHDENMRTVVEKGVKEREEAEKNKEEDKEDPIDTDPFKELEFATECRKEFEDLIAKDNSIEPNKPATEFGQLYWKIREHFIKKGIEYDPFLVRLEDDKVYLSCGKEFELILKDGILYRSTMEEIYNLDVLLYEIEKQREKNDNERMKREERAKQHFFQFLSEENRKRFRENQYVVLESPHNTYVIHKLKSYNNILKISKESGQKRALCITPKEPKISEFDVFTTIVMLLQSGKEDYFLEIANEYPFLSVDEDIFQTLFKKEKIA